jgi:hypothetical protein
MKKTLSEAAAEILKASHSSAPAQPRQTLDDKDNPLGTGQDLGGDTPSDVESENPDPTGPIGKAKEPGPSPRVGSDPKKGLKSNNANVDIDKQKLGPNTEDAELDHVHQQSNEQVDPAAEGEEIFMDEQGNFFDAEGNQLDPSQFELVEDEETEESDGEEIVEGTDSVVLFDREAVYEAFRNSLDEDLGNLLDSDSTLTEDFKKSAKAVFEAAVMARVNAIMDTLEEAFVGTLKEAVDEIKGDLTEKTNDYLSYVAEEWLKENEIAIEKSLRTELTEDFINGLKSLFQEHFIDIPDDKVDVVQELGAEVEEIETKLNEEIAKNIDLSKQVKTYQAKEVLTTVCEKLTDVQKDKMKTLSEGVEFTTEGEYKEKLELVRDNYFLKEKQKEAPKADGGLNETIEIEDDKKVAASTDPDVGIFTRALKRTQG